ANGESWDCQVGFGGGVIGQGWDCLVAAGIGRVWRDAGGGGKVMEEDVQ
nr:hypothetical protein [Tanacetum cinerariifolium]